MATAPGVECRFTINSAHDRPSFGRRAAIEDGAHVDVGPLSGLSSKCIDMAIRLDCRVSGRDGGHRPDPFGQKGDIPAMRFGSVRVDVLAKAVSDNSRAHDRDGAAIDGLCEFLRMPGSGNQVADGDPGYLRPVQRRAARFWPMIGTMPSGASFVPDNSRERASLVSRL